MSGRVVGVFMAVDFLVMAGQKREARLRADVPASTSFFTDGL